MTRSRPRLSAAARGLGSGHQSERQQALATMAEGQLCARHLSMGIEHPLSRALISRSKDGLRWVAPLLDLDDFPGADPAQDSRVLRRVFRMGRGRPLGQRRVRRDREPRRADALRVALARPADPMKAQ